jgi:hypothetical protein
VPLSGQMLPPIQGEDFSMREKVTLSALLMLFAACLMTVFHVMPYWTVLGISLVWFVFFERDVLGKVDYSLLITFIFFFVFIGNMGRIPAMRDAIASILAGREMIVSFLCSQIISNVPAAVLLSGFTDHWKDLLFGVNIGGLGTLIASMASLISYKFFVQANEKAKGKYLKHFTIMNILFAIPLLVVAFFL